MSKYKPVTPYQRLLTEMRDYCDSVDYRPSKTMWLYPKAKLGESWSLLDLYERVAAAEQLGHDVMLEAVADGLRVTYVRKIPMRPWAARRA